MFAALLSDDFIEWCQLSVCEIIPPIPSLKTTHRGFQRPGFESERQFSTGVAYAVSEFATRRHRVRSPSNLSSFFAANALRAPQFIGARLCYRRGIVVGNDITVYRHYATTTGSGSWRCNFRAAERVEPDKKKERGRERDPGPGSLKYDI